MAVLRALGATFKDFNTSSRYLIESFPVAVCRNCRIPVCKLLQGNAYRGYNEANRADFYGLNKRGRIIFVIFFALLDDSVNSMDKLITNRVEYWPNTPK